MLFVKPLTAYAVWPSDVMSTSTTPWVTGMPGPTVPVEGSTRSIVPAEISETYSSSEPVAPLEAVAPISTAATTAATTTALPARLPIMCPLCCVRRASCRRTLRQQVPHVKRGVAGVLRTASAAYGDPYPMQRNATKEALVSSLNLRRWAAIGGVVAVVAIGIVLLVVYGGGGSGGGY